MATANSANGPSLSSLAQNCHSMMAEISGEREFPRVKRSVAQLAAESERMLKSVTEGAPSREQREVQAAILLGSRGFDLPKLSHQIDSLPTTRSFGPLKTIQPTDIDGFLTNERQNALLALIADTARNTQEEVDAFVSQAQIDRWETEKRKVLSSIELTAEQGSAAQRLQAFNDSVTQFSTRPREAGSILTGAPMKAQLTPEEMKYSKALAEHNADVLAGARIEAPTLIERMAKVAESLELKDVGMLWELLQSMQHCEPVDSDWKPLAMAARRFLEKKHLKDIRAAVYGNLNRAALGGVPGTAKLIRAYLNVKTPPAFPGEPVYEGHPVWVVIYHALRCGDLACAREIATKNDFGDFAALLQECQRDSLQRLSERTATELRFQFTREFGGGGVENPYRRAVYAALAGCDVTNEHKAVGNNIEDYLWINLCKVMVKPSAGYAPDSITFENLQALIYEDFGESHFDAYQRPLQYAYVLILTVQFELAIEFLYRLDAQKAHAVHMAIALNDIGLLVRASRLQDPLLIKEDRVHKLNLARLITSYTRRFEMLEPELALEYYYTLMNNYKPLWTQCITELVLETKAFQKILGQRTGGGVTRGALDKFVTDRHETVTVVAEAAEARGLNEEAVALYDLAGERDKCVDLLTKLLSLQVTQAGPEGSKRYKLHKIAQQIAERHASRPLLLLLDLMEFYDRYHASKNEEALDLIRRLNIIPLNMHEVDTTVSTFCVLTEQVRRVIPDVLIAIMTILAEQYRKMKRPAGQNAFGLIPLLGGGSEKKLDLIKTQANAIIKFAGIVPYRLPATVNAKLVQMEASMA